MRANNHGSSVLKPGSRSEKVREHGGLFGMKLACGGAASSRNTEKDAYLTGDYGKTTMCGLACKSASPPLFDAFGASTRAFTA